MRDGTQTEQECGRHAIEGLVMSNPDAIWKDTRWHVTPVVGPAGGPLRFAVECPTALLLVVPLDIPNGKAFAEHVVEAHNKTVPVKKPGKAKR